MTEHNAQAVQAAAEAVLGVLDGRLTATVGLGPTWLRSLAFDAACAAVDAATPHVLAAARPQTPEPAPEPTS